MTIRSPKRYFSRESDQQETKIFYCILKSHLLEIDIGIAKLQLDQGKSISDSQSTHLKEEYPRRIIIPLLYLFLASLLYIHNWFSFVQQTLEFNFPLDKLQSTKPTFLDPLGSPLFQENQIQFLSKKSRKRIHSNISLSKMHWLWPFSYLVLLFFYVPTCKSSSISDLFNSWCQQYGKTYNSVQEKEYRLKVFEENYAYVSHHNSLGNFSYSLSLNAYADLTQHEFKAKYLGLSPSPDDLIIRLNRGSSPVEGLNLVRESDIPSSLDWRKKGAVTGVKDQGSCGMQYFLFIDFLSKYLFILRRV